MKVIYSNGWAAGEETVGKNKTIEVMPSNLSPYITPDHIEIQRITPHD